MDEEEEEPVPADMGTSAEAMQVSMGEEEDGEEEENDENWLSRHDGLSPRPEGFLPAAKRPRLSTKPGVSPEWSYEPREPLSSLNSQQMPPSPSPPLSPELPPPPVVPPTLGHKPKLPSQSPARQKNKSPKRGVSVNIGALGRPLMLTPPKTNKNAGKRSPGVPRSPRSPRPSPSQLGMAGQGLAKPPMDDNSCDGQFKNLDTGDQDIENSIAAVIARACSGGDGGSDPFAYDSDSDSEGPSPPKPLPKQTLTQMKPTQALPGKNLLPPLLPFLNPPSRWTMDDSIDEVIRKASQVQKPFKAPSLSPPEPTYLSSPPDSPQTPPTIPLKLPQEIKDSPTGNILKKKLKKDIKAKLKKKDKERFKDKGKEKGKNKDKNREKKREKERGQIEENKMPWPELMLGAGGEERKDGIVTKKEKDKHKDKKKDREKNKKEKRDKGKDRGKDEKRISQGAKDIAAAVAATSPLFSPQTCLRVPSMLPPLPPILPDKLFPYPKEIKSKDKDKKKDKKEKKKKKEKEKDREKDHEKERIKERVREKEEKKKDKEKKEKAKEKDKPKIEKPSLMAEILPAVPPSPVIPRLTLRVGPGQDKIVISKVVADSEPSFPPPRTPIARSGPGARIRSPPASVPLPIPPAPGPMAPAPRPSPVLPPPTPSPLPVQMPPSQARARGCSVITETVSAYVVVDEWGNQIWICPGCEKPDDGSPMIGCDECDDWYHWACVGIMTAPPEDQSWYCIKCAGKKKDKKTKKRKRKAH
ncbi:hypothetical protein DNTS_003531 [Danionella cerebrum]|uniref:Transcription initiation factor TFIID subunit 3 n=1 Tax=Danionella cerebrum TaxID=2873325 RepID=A0A553QWZ5_9TELE|nr:hypothetical protein DNTS_003531 [Danionella translucida]